MSCLAPASCSSSGSSGTSSAPWGRKAPQSLDGPWWSLRTFWGVVSHTLPFHSGKQTGWNRCSCVFFLVRKVGIQSCICFCFVAFLHFAFGCLGSSKHCRRVPKHRVILGPVHLDVSSVAWHIQQWAARTYTMASGQTIIIWDQGTLQPVCVLGEITVDTSAWVSSKIQLYRNLKFLSQFMESTCSDFLMY